MKYYKYEAAIELERGAVLPEVEIAYCTYGELNEQKDNVIWICHALTANAEADDWWEGLVGEGKLFDPAKYYIVCANMLGSCYGTTGPDKINPISQTVYGKDFPFVSIRDMVKVHQLLKTHLGIPRIKLAIGGSMGGQQVLEWAIMAAEDLENICVIASNAFHSPWGIAFNESQRMAIEADQTLHDSTAEAGRKGLEAARAIAMLSYRHYETYSQTQADAVDTIENHNASSYQRYQGHKLWKRFNVFSYLTLSKAMDSHNVGRGRGSVEQVLSNIQIPTLAVGIQSDILFPVSEQRFIAQHIPNSQFVLIDSIYGHDGFLIEYDKLTAIIDTFLEKGGNRIFRTSHMIKSIYPGMEQF